MKGRKIVHMTTVHHPLDTRIFYKECRSLAEAGFDVTLIATEHEDLRKLPQIPFQVITLPKARGRLLRMAVNCWRAYRIARKLKADLYHFHDPELMLVALFLKRRDNAVVYDVHEDYETSIRQKRYLPRPLRLLAAALYRAMEKGLTRSFEICLAEKYYQDIFPQGRTVLNYPIAKESGEDEAPAESAASPDLTESLKAQHVLHSSHSPVSHDVPQDKPDIRLIYTGNVTRDRGALIHAALPALSPRIRLSVVGKCGGALAEEMQTLAGSGRDRLHIRGIDSFITRDEIDRMYATGQWTAGLALFPPTEHYMKKELTKFFEYMNAGIPIICSNFPAWTSFVEEHQCGIAVDPYNEAQIVKAVVYLSEHPEEAALMGQRGRLAVRRTLSWQSEASKLVDWYQEILTERVIRRVPLRSSVMGQGGEEKA